MRIGLFGGTFDPVHHGHLLLARDCVEKIQLDRLVFIPNTISPHKESLTSAPGPLRLEMLQGAVAGEPHLEVDDLELRRGGPSYAIETVEEYERRFPEAELFYLIGEDNIAKLPTWRRYAELMQRVKFVALSRRGEVGGHPFPLVQRDVEISATEVRMRVAKGASVRYLVPKEVLEVIERENLYKEKTY